MKPTDAQRREIKRLIAKWRPRLYLGEWHFDVEYMKEPPPPQATVGSGDVMAEVQACPVYLQATIMIYPEFWKAPAWRRERALVHELSHCLTQEIFEVIRALWRDETVSQREARERLERLTQRITYIAFHQQRHDDR